MILDRISINNLKCKIIFLLTRMKHTELEAVPRKYKSELKQLMNDLQTYISEEEYKDFFSEYLEIPLQSVIEEAENIIKNSHKNRGSTNGKSKE